MDEEFLVISMFLNVDEVSGPQAAYHVPKAGREIDQNGYFLARRIWIYLDTPFAFKNASAGSSWSNDSIFSGTPSGLSMDKI